MNEELKRRRDELAEKHKHHARTMSPNEQDIFCDGFAAALSELQKMSGELNEDALKAELVHYDLGKGDQP